MLSFSSFLDPLADMVFLETKSPIASPIFHVQTVHALRKTLHPNVQLQRTPLNSNSWDDTRCLLQQAIRTLIVLYSAVSVLVNVVSKQRFSVLPSAALPWLRDNKNDCGMETFEIVKRMCVLWEANQSVRQFFDSVEEGVSIMSSLQHFSQ